MVPRVQDSYVLRLAKGEEAQTSGEFVTVATTTASVEFDVVRVSAISCLIWQS